MKNANAHSVITRIENNILKNLLRLGKITPFIHLALATAIYFLLKGLVSTETLASWLSFIAIVSVTRIIFRSPKLLNSFTPRAGYLIFSILAVLQALVWGVGIALLSVSIPVFHEVILILMAAGMVAAALAILRPSSTLYGIYATSLLIPIIIGEFIRGDSYAYVIAAALFSYLIAMIFVAVGLHRSYNELRRARIKIQKQDRAIGNIYSVAKDISFISCDMSSNDPRILAFSPGAEIMFGCNRNEVLSQPLSIIPSLKSNEKWQEILSKIRKDLQARKDELILAKRNGEPFTAIFSVYPFCDEYNQIDTALIAMTDITERKQAEEISRLMQFSIDKAADPVFWMGPDARFIYVNDAACPSLGYSREELLSMTVHDIDPDFPEEVWPEHWENIKRERSFTLESHHRRKDGKVFPVEIAGNYIKFEGKEFNCVFAKDITMRKQTEEVLRESAEKFRLLSEQSLLAIAIIQDDLIKYVNQATAEILGYSIEEISKWEANEFAKVIHPDDLQFVMEQGRKKQAGDKDVVTNYSYRLVTKSGKTIWANQYSKTVLYEGRNADFVTIIDITDRKAAEEALRESEKRFRDIAISSSDWIWEVDINAKYTYASEGVENVLGYKQTELIGKTPFDLMAKDETETIRKIFTNIASKKEKIKDLVNWNIHKDGHLVCLQTNGVPILDDEGNLLGYRGVDKDITERQRTEELLRRSERKYRTLVESMHDGVGIVDLDENILFANHAACDIFGYDANELIGMNFRHLAVEEDLNKIYKGTKRRKNKEHGKYELAIRRKDGQLRQIYISATPLLGENDEVLGSIGIFTDITEIKQAEKEKQELRDKLVRAQRMESIGVLAGGVAHDLNNILGPLVAYPELIKAKLPPDSPILDKITKIEKSAQRAAGVVQDLLTMARRGRYEMEPIDINGIMDSYFQSADFMNLRAKYPELRIRTEFDSTIPMVYGSFTHLSKVIMNLTINAFEAMPNGGEFAIRTECKYVKKLISGFDNIDAGRYNIITISDTGLGMDKKALRHLFEPFYTKKEMGRSGSGLGLAIVYGVVKDHNGYIDVISGVSRGSDFVIYLPIVEVNASKDDKRVLDIHGNEKILVVDDVEEQRELAETLLSSLGYEVDVVPEGRMAVEYLKNKNVDVVVLDMIMEDDFDGLDTYREIIKHRPGQKAIIASGFSETDRVREAEKLGVGKYIRKPYTRQILGKAIREVLVT